MQKEGIQHGLTNLFKLIEIWLIETNLARLVESMIIHHLERLWQRKRKLKCFYNLRLEIIVKMYCDVSLSNSLCYVGGRSFPPIR